MRHSVTCYGLNVVFTLLPMKTFKIMVQLMDLVARRDGYVEGVGT